MTRSHASGGQLPSQDQSRHQRRSCGRPSPCLGISSCVIRSVPRIVLMPGLVKPPGMKFCRWIDGVGYDLEIGRRGGSTSFVSWRILPSTRVESTLRIAVYPHALQQLPVAIRWLPHRLRLRPMLRKYLSSVVGGFEWYVTRGEAVPRDQFGSHPWFSARGSGAGERPGTSLTD